MTALDAILTRTCAGAHLAAWTVVMTSLAGCGASTECLRDRGCEAPPPARCAAAEESRTVDEVLASHEGEVIVTGFLTMVSRGCTRLDCLDGSCCNACEGQLALTTAPDVPVIRTEIRDGVPVPPPPHIPVSLGDLTACQGDDSLVCCGVAIGGPARARGRVTESPPGSPTLEATELCVP